MPEAVVLDVIADKVDDDDVAVPFAEKYIPLAEREIRDEDMIIPVKFLFCSDLRKRLFKWYPGPTIMGHKMHWTEYLFGFFFILSILLLLVAQYLQGAEEVYGAGLVLVSALALIFVWGIAKYKSIAESASELENQALQLSCQTQVYQLVNTDWENSLETSEKNLKRFTQNLDFIEKDIDDLQEVEQKLLSFTNKKKQGLRDAKALMKVQKTHQVVVRENIKEQDRSNFKRSIMKFFDRIDRRGVRDGVLSGEEIPKLMEVLEADKFINATNEAGELLYPDWRSAVEETQDDGEIQKFELLEVIDRVTDSWYVKIIHASDINKNLKEELQKVQEEHKAYNNRGGKPEMSRFVSSQGSKLAKNLTTKGITQV